jgi:hypothetical protein
MQIPSALSIPLHVIAQGLRRMVTTSGSVTRYQWHDAFKENGGVRYKVFKWLERGKPAGAAMPFTLTPQQVHEQYILAESASTSSGTSEVSLEDGSSDHVKTRRFLGINFRCMRSAIATTRSKNVLLTSFNRIPQFNADVLPFTAPDSSAPGYATIDEMKVLRGVSTISEEAAKKTASQDVAPGEELYTLQEKTARRMIGSSGKSEGSGSQSKPDVHRVRVTDLQKALRKPVVLGERKKINRNPLSVGGMTIVNPNAGQRGEAENLI